MMSAQGTLMGDSDGNGVADYQISLRIGTTAGGVGSDPLEQPVRDVSTCGHLTEHNKINTCNYTFI